MVNVDVGRLKFCTLTSSASWTAFEGFLENMCKSDDQFENPCNLQMQHVIIVSPLCMCHMHVHLLLGITYL